MPIKKKRLFVTVMAALVVALFLARFIAISNHYPFYILWDMDLLTTIDTVLINSGQVPDHLNHPAFGTYLVQTLSERMAHGMGILSTIRLNELDGALNPAAAMAELTTYLRLHTPFVAIGLVLSLWAAMCLILRPGPWISLLFLAAFGMQESLAYHASLIRTELYAMFFWSLALVMLALGVRARGTRGLHGWLAAAGVFLGLCFLTKVQSFFHLPAFALLALLSLSLTDRPGSPLRTAPSRGAARAFTITAAANLVIFLALMLASCAVTINLKIDGKDVTGIFTKSFGPNPFALIFGVGAAALAGGSAFLYVRQRTETLSFRLLNLATLLFSGFLGSFLLHFLLYKNPGTSLTYLLSVFKMVFMRELDSQQHFAYIIINPWGFIAYHPLLFAVHLALLLLLVFGFLYKFIELKPVQLALCTALTLLALALLQLSVRFFLRDLLWEEVLINVLNFYYFTLIWRGARRFTPRLRAGAVAGLLALLLVSTAHGWDMPRRIAMNINKLGFQVDFWQKAIYNNHQMAYQAVMDRHYTWDQWKVARRVANSADWNRTAAEYVFQNQRMTHRNIGTVAEGFPVWTGKQDWRIAACTEDLKEAIVVDSAALPLERNYFSDNQYVKEHSEYLEKFKAAPGKDLLSLLPRMDLQVLLFVPRGMVEGAGAAPYVITLRRGNETAEFAGVEFKDYTELPVGQLGRDYFFVLKRKW